MKRQLLDGVVAAMRAAQSGTSPGACLLLTAGTVRVQLLKGNVIVTGRKSPYSLYDQVVASFEDDKGMYNQVRVKRKNDGCAPQAAVSLEERAGGRPVIAPGDRAARRASGGSARARLSNPPPIPRREAPFPPL